MAASPLTFVLPAEHVGTNSNIEHGVEDIAKSSFIQWNSAALRNATEWLKTQPAGAVVVNDTLVLSQINDGEYNQTAYTTFVEAVRSEVARNTGRIYVLSMHNDTSNTTIDLAQYPVVDGNLTLRIVGFLHAGMAIGTIAGTLSFENSDNDNLGIVHLDNLLIHGKKTGIVVKIDHRVTVIPNNTSILRESSYDKKLVHNSDRVRGNFKEIIVPPGSLKKMAMYTVGGAAVGATVYGVWLFALLFAAGGPISLGPAAMVFGPMALGWSGTLGTAVFSIIGGTVGYPLYHAKKWIFG